MGNFDSKYNSSFDLISPLWAFAQDLLHGSHADFGVNSLVFGKSDIRRVLDGAGIESWGHFIHSDDVLYFTTTKQHAKFAKYVLERAKINLLYWPACAE